MHNILIVAGRREESRIWETGLNSLKQDFNITLSLSGEEALLEAGRQKFDLLISEISLTGMTGTELLTKLKNDNAELLGILIGEDGDNEVQQKVAEAGADAYFVKPVELADLLDSVERILGFVETLLPNEMQVTKDDLEEAKPKTISLSDRIMFLRQELEAECVYLMNDLGQVLVRAGEMPDKAIETKLTTDLMAVIFTNNRVSTFLGDTSSNNFSFFKGKSINLTIFPVGKSFALLMATSNIVGLKIETITSAMGAAVKDIFSTLYILGLVTKAGITGQLKKDNTGMLIDPEMDVIFKDAKTKQIDQAKIDSFWQSMPDEKKYDNIAGEKSLSFDEASELGLTPKDK